MGISSESFSAFDKLKVLIIGDVMVDRYLFGKVDRISPEAPVPVVAIAKEENRLGGAANVALNVKAMGAMPYLCSVVGNDAAADELLGLMRLNGLSTNAILASSTRPTTTKTRVLSKNQQLLRFDKEETCDLNQEDTAGLLTHVANVVAKRQVDVILFQDYNKGVLTLEVIRKVMLMAIKRNIPTIVDPKQRNFLAYESVTLFKPNLREVKDNFQVEVAANDLAGLDQLGAKISVHLSNKYTLITLSEGGIYLYGPEGGAIFPTQKRQIADVCGAGDTVVSIVALGLALEMDMSDVVILANLAGGQVCERVGVVSVNKQQLMEEYAKLLQTSDSGYSSS